MQVRGFEDVRGEMHFAVRDDKWHGAAGGPAIAVGEEDLYLAASRPKGRGEITVAQEKVCCSCVGQRVDDGVGGLLGYGSRSCAS